jgi:hypothetical protein
VSPLTPRERGEALRHAQSFGHNGAGRAAQAAAAAAAAGSVESPLNGARAAFSPLFVGHV